MAPNLPDLALGLHCPNCNFSASRVLTTRPSAGTIHRRRECMECHTRWSTTEAGPASPNTSDREAVVELVSTAQSNLDRARAILRRL